MLLTVDGAANIPQAAAFQKEVTVNLAKQKVRVVRMAAGRPLAAGVESFFVEAESAGQRVFLLYLLVRQAAGGAVLTANLRAAELTSARQDVEGIARSLVLTAPAKRGTQN